MASSAIGRRAERPAHPEGFVGIRWCGCDIPRIMRDSGNAGCVRVSRKAEHARAERDRLADEQNITEAAPRWRIWLPRACLGNPGSERLTKVHLTVQHAAAIETLVWINAPKARRFL